MRVFGVPLLCGTLFSYFSTVKSSLVTFPSVVIPLSGLFDNQAASLDGTTGNFDGNGATYAAEYLPEGPWLYNGIPYDLPSTWGQSQDNVIAGGQVVKLSNVTYVHELHVMYVWDRSDSGLSGTFSLKYADHSVKYLPFTGQDWLNINGGAIRTPYHFEEYSSNKNWNSTQIFQLSLSVPSRAPLESITLPEASSTSNRLHIFALSMTPSFEPTSGLLMPQLSVRSAEFSTRWEDINGKRAQAVAITLANLLPGSYAISSNTSINSRYEISVTGEGVSTVTPGLVYRLVPTDQVRMDVFVLNNDGKGNATITIKDEFGNVIGTSMGWPIALLRTEWTAEANVLATHETPTWWNQAKYGIFIHWGIYSVPAWGPPSSYAEWYDWNLRNPPNSNSPTWAHHLDTYGKDVVYDDFIANFTASTWNPRAWLDLFSEAGAKYFVIVTKHHDGYALFDTKNTTHRSSVYLKPHRDFVKELMNTAKSDYPDIHRGTYYSLPEWFNPYFSKYGFSSWPGGLAHNAFNASELEPYTGILNISDYIEDLQYPQMVSLALDYDTEIMWCDGGGHNKTLDFAAQFYNKAMQNGYQVTMNDRCGAVPDFDTPEYATLGSLSTRHWETNEGMDPYSYGLNSATNASEYKNGTTIIQTLVDVVSKNGNYLLDVGPNAEGDIIAPMADNLLAAGKWLKYAGDCVYATDYWYQASQDPTESFRFLTTRKTFCIIAFNKPSDGKVTVDAGGVAFPIQKGDSVVLLGPSRNSQSLEWDIDVSGILTIVVPQDEVDQVDYAWAFQVTYSG
ncbi:glycoside hydrolase family 29 protein [Suillus plorans]|uniref:alpha-L-fucosidase n=1 Tax=Suillus plorans TaxID=116603 RepID=A0A9P7ARU6_9AGAM|nr:glycoside hydrolase family 29 protein [Suillus plorans]KAG1794155.1 glycoside hydrolase family 29 protein [Suillus plorans]KAG1828519.1 glycoside hydrolase family 29 protein [Suillus variegatus]